MVSHLRDTGLQTQCISALVPNGALVLVEPRERSRRDAASRTETYRTIGLLPHTHTHTPFLFIQTRQRIDDTHTNKHTHKKSERHFLHKQRMFLYAYISLLDHVQK